MIQRMGARSHRRGLLVTGWLKEWRKDSMTMTWEKLHEEMREEAQRFKDYPITKDQPVNQEPQRLPRFHPEVPASAARFMAE